MFRRVKLCIKIERKFIPFIQQGCIKLTKNDSKVIYNVTKDFYFKLMLFFWTFYSAENPEKKKNLYIYIYIYIYIKPRLVIALAYHCCFFILIASIVLIRCFGKKASAKWLNVNIYTVCVFMYMCMYIYIYIYIYTVYVHCFKHW